MGASLGTKDPDKKGINRIEKKKTTFQTSLQRGGRKPEKKNLPIHQKKKADKSLKRATLDPPRWGHKPGGLWHGSSSVRKKNYDRQKKVGVPETRGKRLASQLKQSKSKEAKMTVPRGSLKKTPTNLKWGKGGKEKWKDHNGRKRTTLSPKSEKKKTNRAVTVRELGKTVDEKMAATKTSQKKWD